MPFSWYLPPSHVGSICGYVGDSIGDRLNVVALTNLLDCAEAEGIATTFQRDVRAGRLGGNRPREQIGTWYCGPYTPREPAPVVLVHNVRPRWRGVQNC